MKSTKLIIVVSELWTHNQLVFSKKCLYTGLKEIDKKVPLNNLLKGIESCDGTKKICLENCEVEVIVDADKQRVAEAIMNGLLHEQCLIIYAGEISAPLGHWLLRDGVFHSKGFLEVEERCRQPTDKSTTEKKQLVLASLIPCDGWIELKNNSIFQLILCPYKPNRELSMENQTNYIEIKILVQRVITLLTLSQNFKYPDNKLLEGVIPENPAFHVFVDHGSAAVPALLTLDNFAMVLNCGYNRNLELRKYLGFFNQLDVVLLTHIDYSNLHGLTSIAECYDQHDLFQWINHLILPVDQEKLSLLNDLQPVPLNPLIVNLQVELSSAIRKITHSNEIHCSNLAFKQKSLINVIHLYHKMGYGQLDLIPLCPFEDDSEVKKFEEEWKKGKFSNESSPKSVPISASVLLLWKPCNEKLPIKRVLYIGSKCSIRKYFPKIVPALHASYDCLKKPDLTLASDNSENSEHQATVNCNIEKTSKEMNILLLGETGVGKSTWINGFVNYLTYQSLNEAVKGDPVCLIPSKFTVTDSHFNEHTITYGCNRDIDEVTHITGQSATQIPKTYTFEMKNVVIRIIDTPGIGDTRGIDQDKVNMQNIMSHLSHYKDLNGIIILLKPNNARLNVMFKFCIKELLTHLHKDACKNIVICFTNARSTFYRPGDTMPALRELLKKDQSIEIKLTHETIYCMDNEPVRFLMAVKSIALEFDPKEQEEYENSWKKAVTETLKLIHHISSLDPHVIQKTLSINEVRRSIIEQSRPMALIAKAIQTNIGAIKDKKEEIISVKSSKAELLRKLKVPAVHLKITDIDHPRTVCTSASCVSKISAGINKEVQTHYRTICHNECQITTDKNVIKCIELQGCWAMHLDVNKCRVCSCPWDTHMHITYDSVQETIMVEDEGIKKLINQKTGNQNAIKRHKEQLNDKLLQLEYEKKRIAEVNANFACFLKHNAIAPFNDALLDYINHLIEDEKMKVGVGSRSETLDGLRNIRSVYQEEINVIEEAIKNKTDNVETLDVKKIDELMFELKQLPNVGEMLNGVMPNVKKANERSTELNENVVKLKSESSLSQMVSCVVKFSEGVVQVGKKAIHVVNNIIHSQITKR